MAVRFKPEWGLVHSLDEGTVLAHVLSCYYDTHRMLARRTLLEINSRLKT